MSLLDFESCLDFFLFGGAGEMTPSLLFLNIYIFSTTLFFYFFDMHVVSPILLCLSKLTLIYSFNSCNFCTLNDVFFVLTGGSLLGSTYLLLLVVLLFFFHLFFNLTHKDTIYIFIHMLNPTKSFINIKKVYKYGPT